MGGILSSQATTIAVSEVSPKQTTVEETKSNDAVQSTTTLAAETTTEFVTESNNKQVSDPKSEEVSVTTNESKPEEVMERYVEPNGTPFEVAPVDVNPLTDVVKKNKKKNKKNKSKN